MQQYRINFPLVIGLIVGSLVTSAAVYGLWSYQIDRNADALIVAAEQAEADGDLKTAAHQYGYYLSIRSAETDVHVKMANVWADIAEQSDVLREDIARAREVLEQATRNFPQETELRRRLVDFYRRFGAVQESLDHLGILLAADPDNSELLVQQVQLLVQARKFDEAINETYRLVGYDKEADAFDVEQALAPHDADVYSTLAMLIRAEKENSELADRVMAQMIEVNPESAAAYLRRGTYYISVNEPEKGQRDLDMAYQLEPDNADVLASCGSQATRNENYEQARKYFETGKKNHPEDFRFYLALSDVELREQNSEAAVALMDEGLKAVPKGDSAVLLLKKAELLLRTGDVKAVRDAVEEMRTARFAPEYIQYMEGQILVSQGKWFEALKALRALQTKFSNHPHLAIQINFQIGLCNEKLGRSEKALEAYNLVLQQSPLNEPASLGRQRILQQFGRPDEDDKNQQFQKLIAEEIDKPKPDRNWAKVDALAKEFAEKMEYQGEILDMFWARLMLAREDFDAARNYLRAASKKAPDNIQVHRLAVQVVRFDPALGPAKAMQLLDRVESQFGDQPQLRLDRADLILSSDVELEDKKSRITSLTEGISDWTDDQKAELLDGLAPRYLALGMREQAVDQWDRVANLRPNDLPARLRLFLLAAEANDDAGMQAAQDKVLEFVKSKNDSTWLYTEARRMLSLYRRDQLEKSALAEIDRLINRAFNLRPDWFELHLVKAELELVQGNDDVALEHLEKAHKLGRANPQAILQHVRILLNRGQYLPAKALVEQLPQALREGQVAQVYAEILLNTGKVAEAAEVARKYAELAAEDADRQRWYGQLLVRSAGSTDISPEQQKSFVEDADRALRKSVELGPTSQEAWLALISLQVLKGDKAQQLEVLRLAQLALPEDQLVGVLAKGLEIMGHWFDAENIYVTLHQADPENLAIARQLATFYLGPYYQRPDKVEKATPLINQMLRAAADGTLEPNDENVKWARRMGAQMLAATKDYQSLLRAEKLLRSNSQDGNLSVEDQLRMAEILAPRNEPESRVKALRLLERVAQQQRLNLQGDLTLGQLYFAVGDWRKCRQQMRGAISRYPDSAEARMTYVRMLLQQGEQRSYDEAARQLEKLRQIAPTNAQTIELMVRVASKTGEQESARANLLKLVPRVAKPEDITEEQLPLLQYIATLLIELEDLQNAEKIYRTIVARDPQKTLALANFLGEHGDVAESMELISRVYRPDLDLSKAAIQVAINVVRIRRDEVGDQYDQQIVEWLNRGQLENPDAMPLLMLSAEFDDLRKHYDESAEAYRMLLGRKELVGPLRAVVLNNLAFLISLAGSSAEVGLDPLKLVEEAAEILGPTADILDTRAVAYISRGEYQKAIDDLTFSVTDNPTPSKYFHKAAAHLGAGENTAAIEAWEKAEELGDIRSDLNRLEYDRFDDVKRQIEQLRAQQRQLTDTDRRRAAG